MSLKSILSMAAIAVVVWWEIKDPHAAADIVMHIGDFVRTSASGLANFFASI